MKMPRFTTSELGSVPGDIRICMNHSHPLKTKRMFLGIHLDFSTHQMILYTGIASLFVEIYGKSRKEGVIDKETLLCNLKGFMVFFHNSNHSKHFFNLGITIYPDHIILFFWQFRLYVPLGKFLK